MKSLEIVNEVLEENDFGILGEEELEQIKADLEVLEIFKNRIVDKETYYVIGVSDYSKEDFNKVKQWLEEN
jgi:hypothetical protein